MMKAPPVATILGPNITAGKGGRTAAYTMADWDRIVRHGIKPDGRPAVMPSEDFLLMSDQELSDVVAFLRSQPTVDAEVERPTFGPIGRMLVATGKFPLSAANITDHQHTHTHTHTHRVAPRGRAHRGVRQASGRHLQRVSPR